MKCYAILSASLLIGFSGFESRAQVPPPASHDTHGHDHGVVNFRVACNEKAQEAIETGLGILHHMMYEQAREQFEAAAAADPGCAMAHWGIAMSHFQPLWAAPTDDSLAQGKAAIAAARSIGDLPEREKAYIDAAAAFYEGEGVGFADRLAAWERAQRNLHQRDPEDVDAAAFYALARIATAPREDRQFLQQREAGTLLEGYFDKHPEHPALFHYLIHAYDNPVLAAEAKRVAHLYDQLAPDVPHALHMPSHIFVRLGEWENAIAWNERSAEAALRQPVNGATSLHYPHALDYLMYAYLQLDDQEGVEKTLERVEAIDQVQPNLASAYGIAAARARYVLEQERWQEAADLPVREPAALAWDEFPACDALIHYARGLGAARSGDFAGAQKEIAQIQALAQAEPDDYWTQQTKILADTVAAWVAYGQGERRRGLATMREAADLDDSLDKHPVTPGAIRPARELYGEMLLLEGRHAEALAACEKILEKAPNRRLALKFAQQARAGE
jgi:tetratricopeptide (TPR) repeat protein